MQIFLGLFILLSLIYCKKRHYTTLRKTITEEKYIEYKELLTKYSTLKENDIAEVKVKIKDVCKKKSC